MGFESIETPVIHYRLVGEFDVLFCIVHVLLADCFSFLRFFWGLQYATATMSKRIVVLGVTGIQVRRFSTNSFPQLQPSNTSLADHKRVVLWQEPFSRILSGKFVA
jgi:hypothetical protein